MQSGECLEDDDRLPVQALLAGLAALCAAALALAALALGAFDGPSPWRRPLGGAGGAGAGLAAAGASGPATAPVPRLCFRNARGEPVDFPAVVVGHCPSAAADAAGARMAAGGP